MVEEVVMVTVAVVVVEAVVLVVVVVVVVTSNAQFCSVDCNALGMYFSNQKWKMV